MSKYIKLLLFAVFVGCVIQIPKQASAQMIKGNNVTYELGTEIDDDNLKVVGDIWCYIHDRTTGNKMFVYTYEYRTKSINIYKSGSDFVVNAQIYINVKYSNGKTWDNRGTYNSPYPVGGVGNDLYVVVGGTNTIRTITFDGVILLNSPNPTDAPTPTPLPTPTNTPTPTPTNTPTPTPMTNIEVSETGLTELFGFTVDVLNIPFQINGYEISLMQILIYSVLASLLIALVFSPGGKD